MEEIFDDIDQKEESNFDLKAEIYKYLTHWKWLLLGLLIGGTLAYLYNRYTIPEFRSEANLMITKSEDNNVSGILPSGGSSGPSILKLDDNSLENQIVTLKSKRLIRKVVDDLDHNIYYYVEGSVITTEAYNDSPVKINFISADSVVNNHSANFTITPVSHDKFTLKSSSSEVLKTYGFKELIEFSNLKFTLTKNLKGQSDFANSNPIQILLRPLEDVAGAYISKLEVGQKGRAMDILSLSLVDETPDKSEDFLNELMFQFNADGVRDKRQVALKTTQFIQDRLEILNSELDSVETGIADFKSENQFMDVTSGASEYLNRKSASRQKIFDIETQLSILSSVQELINQTSKFQLLPENLGAGTSEFQSAISRYNNLILERKALLQNSTEENPVIEDINNQLVTLRNNLKENLLASKNSLKVQLRELEGYEKSATSQFSSFPGMEKGMRSIERQQQIKEQLYLFLLQRREEAAIAFAVTSDVSKVIDPAFTYGSPVNPKPVLILIGGLIIGLLVPILIIFIKNLLDTKVHHKGDLQPLLKSTPFMGEVPRVSAEQSDVIQVNDRSPLAESFRILRTNLAYLIQNKDKDVADVIYVTSTVKGEGKTFVSYNLSRTLASTNKKVLLIGADIRNPKLHRYTSMTIGAKEKGLSDYLYDYNVSMDQVISNTNDENIAVDVVLSGPIPPNPAELLMNDRMEELINKAKSSYDYVIVDTAPTMIVTDTLLISQLADYTLYVTRADFTEKNLLQFPQDLKKQGKLKGVAVILNDVDYSKFSYGAQYGYSYGYGYGYGADEESRWERLKKKLFS
ncbi:GumC family protein [Christiangramia salexigens]|uniref:non-specific protein-tyrosine kinase n=1 Tax=Christiangramia salexigens TaxID=1913577 RepID=A0A1L3J2E7_9FLAO|nr:polysaccharide biosynthesis tyrosine autokinase [Christiangramia salexigens]APG59296.1 tyrosine protein kinase [Christiangramia salexigens]